MREFRVDIRAQVSENLHVPRIVFPILAEKEKRKEKNATDSHTTLRGALDCINHQVQRTAAAPYN